MYYYKEIFHLKPPEGARWVVVLLLAFADPGKRYHCTTAGDAGRLDVLNFHLAHKKLPLTVSTTRTSADYLYRVRNRAA